MPTLAHEKMIVYQRALEAAGAAEVIASAIPQHRSDLRDQLRRASASIALNIAEGAGEFSPAEKARFYRIARRSATEAAAAVDLVSTTTSGVDHARAKVLLAEVVAMLTLLVKRIEERRA